MSDQRSPFAPPGSTEEVEEGLAFAPKFDADGLVTCVATDARLGRRADGRAHERRGAAEDHRHRRSLVFQPLAPSTLAQGRILRPCPARRRDAHRLRPGRGLDQGRAGGPGACHTGRRSCFYRAVPLGKTGAVTLEFRDGERTFDPKRSTRVVRGKQADDFGYASRRASRAPAIAGRARDAGGRTSRRRCRPCPCPDWLANAATTARALATPPVVGVNTSLMTGTCAGWIAILPVKPSRRASSLSRRSAARIAEVDGDGVDRLHLRRRRAGKAERARQPIGIEKTAVPVAVGLGAELGGKVLGAPGEPFQPRAGARDRCRPETARVAVSVAIATILMWPSGRPAIASRAESLASAWTTPAPPSAFGSMMASGRAGTMASRSASVRPVAKPLMRTNRRGRLRALTASLEEVRGALARGGLAVGGDRIFEIDDHRVGAARHRLVELAAAVGRDEEQRAHATDRFEPTLSCGRMRMKTWRRHSATSLLSWL